MMSKLKRSSFRIDDILSLKTRRSGDLEEDDGDDLCEHAPPEVMSEEYDEEEDFDIDVEDSLDGGESIKGEDLDVGGVEIGCDVIGDSPPGPCDVTITRRGEIPQSEEYPMTCDNISEAVKSDRLAPAIRRGSPLATTSPINGGFPFSSKLSTVHKLSFRQFNSPEDNKTTNAKTYPLIPQATKLPTSLESLVKSQRPDYYLQLSGLTQKISQWPLFRSELFMGMPTTGHYNPAGGLMGLHGIGLSPTDQKTHCICGSPTCAERTEALHSDGPHNFLRPSNSPNSPAHDPSLSVPVPLPVYVRTRETTSLDGSMKPKRCRRSRTVFSELQLMGLEKKFECQKYLSTPDRLDLAETLGLTQLQVKTWYQNRRMKWKKQVMQGGGTEPPTKPKGRPRKDSLYPEGSPCSSVDTTCDKLL